MSPHHSDTPIEIGLAAAVVAVERGQPQILVTGSDTDGEALPYGRFDPLAHRTLEIALRDFVTTQTGLSLGYVEQLYTFADRGRHARPDDDAPHVVSIGYLALTRFMAQQETQTTRAAFRSWYAYFPWEDWRAGRPPILDDMIAVLSLWAADRKAEQAHAPQRALSRIERIRLAFGIDPSPWDEEKVLERYELLYEAGLVHEALRDGRAPELPPDATKAFGRAMRHDHRRILATAMGRLRAKLKYRPVVFELMSSDFTLTALQHTLEALSGRHVHKQNFRRLVETSALVEPTGQQTTTRGRPAALFRFRRDVLQERPAPGLRVGTR